MTSPKPNTTDAVQAGREERLREEPETKGPYEARICKDVPTSCCDYGVVSLSMGRELCRVWTEQDARAIAFALSEPRPVVETGEAVAWQWRSRIKGGAWDAWENGRYGKDIPPFMDIEERPLFTTPDFRRAEKVETERDEAADDPSLWRFWNAKARDLATRLDAERAAREKAEQEAAGLREVLKAVDQHDRSNFHADTSGKAQRSSWRGVMRKVRAALQAQPSGQTETGV